MTALDYKLEVEGLTTPERLARLEKILSEPQKVKLDDLPLADLRRKLEREWQSDDDAVRTTFAPAVVTSLPTAPVDGQEIYYVADATLGIVWHLKYRAASASAYKWEFVGGSPLVSIVDAPEAVNSAVFANPATVGPDATAPLAGDWDVEWTAVAVNGAAPIVTVQSGVNVAGVAPTVTLQANVTLNAANHQATLVGDRRLFGLTAATLCRMQYASGPAQVITWSIRRISLTPVRVG